MFLLVILLVELAPALVACFGTKLAIMYARSRQLFDVPNERSSHKIPTPRSGGVAVVAGVVVALLLWDHRDASVPLLLPAVAIACAVGLWDDVRSMRPALKMVLVLTAAAAAARATRVELVHGMPYSADVDLGWEAWPLTLFWLACYPNAFNFMDGVNGIAGLTAVISAAAFAFAAPNDVVLRNTASATSLAALGFLPWNFPKARIFMGDAGSLPLGLLLAWCAVRANATGALPFPASILLLGPFLFDVTFTLIRRLLERKKIGEAHKEHLYQRLSRVWNSHAKVSLLYAGFSVVTGVLALLYGGFSEFGKLLSLVLPLAAMLGFAALVLRAERQKGL